jgi:hypothetical protein
MEKFGPRETRSQKPLGDAAKPRLEQSPCIDDDDDDDGSKRGTTHSPPVTAHYETQKQRDDMSPGSDYQRIKSNDY